MDLSTAVLALLLALPRHTTDRDETTDHRVARLTPIATEMVAAAGRDIDVLRALIVLGDRETHWAAYVSEGRCHEGPVGQRCDAGLARGVWQLHHAACQSAWQYPAGSPESLHEEAKCAAAMLRWGRRTCRSWAGAFGRYAGAGCGWRGGPKRAAEMSRVKIGGAR